MDMAARRTEPASLLGKGTMARLIAEKDWSATPLGPKAQWPEALQTVVRMILAAPVPMAVIWGPDLTLIYNDDYIEIAGGRHPSILGVSATAAFPEIADYNRRVMTAGLAGEATSVREQMLPLNRHGYLENVWLDIDYIPIREAHGRPAGVLAIVNDVTTVVLSDWRRREAETQLALALEATGLGTWDRDLRTGLIIWSKTVKAAFGLPPDATVTQEIFANALHPGDRDATLAALQRASDPALRETYDVEYRAIGVADGVTRWVHSRGKAVFDDAGMALRLVGTMLDITDRKNAELRQACLVELADRLRSLDSTAEIAGVAAELLGRALGASRAGYATISGDYAFVERDWTDGAVVSLAGPRLFTSLGEAYTAPLQAGRLLVIEDTATAPETIASRAAFANVRMTALLNAPLMENGRLAAILYVHDAVPRRWNAHEIQLLRDVADRTWEASGRAAAASALRRLNESLEQEIALRTAQRDRMWKLSSDVMVVARFDGMVESANPAFKAAFGWNEAEVIGRNFLDLTHPSDRAATRAELGRLAEGAATLKFENRYRRRDGSYLWLAWRAVPEAGSIHAVGRDVTAEREQAAALATAEEALRQAQKMEAVGQLTGGIAHDFNNLLQGIVGALGMIEKRLGQGRTEEIERFLAAAQGSADRAVALTHRLLAFSRRQPLDPRPVEANPLVASMEDLLRRTMGAHIDLSLRLAPDLWPTLCDANQLESALLNLAINARDAMPDGGLLVVETENATLGATDPRRGPELKPGDYICLSVSDTGTGMPASVIEQAFEPFFTTKPIGQGTGLGLSMIYGFARQSEGHARIHSKVGEGTTIKLFLPRFVGTLPEDAPAAVPVAAAGGGSGETVLVVEDEEVVRSLVVEVLDELGYRAIEAADGPGGLELLRGKQRVDLLISDIGLPRLNGRQLADAARALRPGLKVLFMTGYAESAAAHGFLEPGLEIITKPFALDTLAARIRKIIEG
jgi:PAS domain S-box-containing protein